MYKSLKFVLFNEIFPNPTKFQIRPNFGWSRISAGFVKKGQISAGAELRYSPNCITALLVYNQMLEQINLRISYVLYIITKIINVASMNRSKSGLASFCRERFEPVWQNQVSAKVSFLLLKTLYNFLL